jgi:branched-chain amino acid transport system substrate-binding protein
VNTKQPVVPPKGKVAKRTEGLNRRDVIAGGAAAVAFAAVPSLSRPALAQSGPIKIGVLAPVSGVYASLGTHKVNGIKMLFDQNAMKIAGRPIELIVEDTEAKPQEGLRKARKLVESDQVDVLLGVLSSAVGNAIKEYVARVNKVWVTTGAAADGIFKKKNNNPYAFRASLSTWQANHPMGTWLAEKGFKRVLLTGPDYAMGREAVEAFRATFEVKGAQKVGEVFVPLGTSDYAPYLSQIKKAEPDLVYASYAGADAVRFVQQYAAFGLAPSIKLAGYGYLVEEDVLVAQGDAALGVQSGINWAYGLDTPENQQFVAEYRKRTNETATVDAVAGYVGAQVVFDAIKSLGGNISSQLDLSQAIAKVKLAKTPRGPISFDPETNNVIQNIYIREVANAGGQLHNKVIATYENVKDPGE